MPSNTPGLGLYKKNPATDGNDTFNIETMLNENWDKIDAVVVTKESPELTGIPTAPTAAAATNTGQIATTAFVQQEIDAIPTTDTSTLAPKANPTFTGTVTLPATTSIGNVSATEIGYLDGVTSAIQTQLNAKLAFSSYTAADVLSKLKTIDGDGSELDADMLDGKHASEFVSSVAPLAGTSDDPNTTLLSYLVTYHANGPDYGTGAYYHIITNFFGGVTKLANCCQLAIQYNGGSKTYTRSRFGEVWTDWKELGGVKVDKTALTPRVMLPTMVNVAVTNPMSFQPLFSVTGKGYVDFFFVSANSTYQTSLKITVDGVVKYQYFIPSQMSTYQQGIVSRHLIKVNNGGIMIPNNNTASLGTYTGVSATLPYPTTGGTGNSGNHVAILPDSLYFESSFMVEYQLHVQGTTTGAVAYFYGGAW